MRKHIIISATMVIATAAVVAAASYASASTTDVLTRGSVGGANVAVGNSIGTHLASGSDATFYTTKTGTDGGICAAGTGTGKVTTNPAVGGTATVSVSSLAFSNCSNDLGFMNVQISIASFALNVSSTGISVPSLSAKMTAVFGHPDPIPVTCSYTTAATGTNLFSNQKLSLTSTSSSLCPSVLFFTAEFGSFNDTSVSGSPAVFLNS